MANFEIKTIKEVFNDFMAKYTTLRSQYNDNTPLLEKSVIKSIGYAIAGVAGTLWRYGVWIYKQCFPQTCDLAALKFWGNLIGVDYKDGQATTITITINDATANNLSTGTIYKDLKTGLIFKTNMQAAMSGGLINATAECTTSGTVGNLPIGTVLNIANPVDGIPATAIISEITIEGSEDELLEDYRKRVLYKFRNKSQGGSPLDYYTWAMEVAEIADALPYVLNEGIITLYCVASGSGLNRTPTGSITPNPYPVWSEGQFTELTGSGQFLQIANAIEGSTPGVHDRRPVMATVDLQPPNYTGFDVDITGLENTNNNELIKNAIVSILDEKRPHLVVLGYSEAGGKVGSVELTAACVEAIGGETFTSFILKDANGNIINEATLDIGCLAYLRTLTINGTVYFTIEDSDND